VGDVRPTADLSCKLGQLWGAKLTAGSGDAACMALELGGSVCRVKGCCRVCFCVVWCVRLLCL